MSGWDELVAAALIGTDRRPVEAGVPEGSPDGLEVALRERGAEDRLLGAAAAWTVARRAGAVAGERVEVDPADDDPRPVAPGTSLRDRLEGVHPSLLGEWLALAAERGLRPPPELVPALLNHAALNPALHAAVGEAGGPLGRWLAERNPSWAFVRGAGDDVDEVWAQGASEERRALLERLRRADPAVGRDLLAHTFAEETWEDRAAFVAALAHGLSDEDEPLLEAALDDRRKPVRDAAAFLLAGLPRSRFGARMAARAAPLLHVEGGRLRGRRIVVELPSEPDAAAKRDGVPSGGRRSERLHALLAATPLNTWELELAELPVGDDLAGVVRGGWAAAAVAQRDAEWARALWAVHPDPALLVALPRDEGEALAARADQPDVAATALTGQWGATLSKAVIDAIHQRRTAGERGADAEFAGYRLDPAFSTEAEERLRDLGGRDLRRLCDILTARAAMLRELS
ncbi:DUF5691 domain-containing protein [Solirubrobacter ginsenosidimutans]|uniref:DUF5691 domain-containing protein n=1 Tax=Solirubrobacter ginsenosidimutans TaxID=490573 RepID=A0A9X3N2C2_9ACTN|nr:DUF5691 domain-containing protein [Solirubrobacter ginsenosidimutans]MDA0166992.1 DUF5691 domain-containing protein [Solirubrobacter ginsenosidimutans]